MAKQITVKQWVEDSGWDANGEGLEVRIAGLSIPRSLWKETIVHNESDIEIVINT